MFILLYLITSFLNIFVFYIWPITLILFISQYYYYTFLIYYFNKYFSIQPVEYFYQKQDFPNFYRMLTMEFSKHSFLLKFLLYCNQTCVVQL